MTVQTSALVETSAPIRVLFIDDDVPARDTVCEQLRELGFSVCCETNGTDGVERVRGGDEGAALDVVLCGLGLPEMTGLEVLAHVRREHPLLPFIVVTSHATVARGVEAIQRGADHFMPKPIKAHEVAVLIRQVVGHARSRKQLAQSLRERTASLEAANAELTRANAQLLATQAQLAQKHAEAEALVTQLSQRNVQLRALIDASPTGLVMADASGRLTAWNRVANELLQIPDHELEGLTIEQLLGRVESLFADKERFRQLSATLLLRPDRPAKQAVDYRRLFQRALGTNGDPLRYLSLFAMPVLGADEQELGSLWVFADVTQARRADEQLHKIVGVSPVPLVITRVSDGSVLFANEPLAALVGLTSEQLTGRQSLDFYYRPEIREKVVEQLRRDGQLRDFEVQFKRADGTPFWAILSLVLTEVAGEAATMGSIYDIDDRKRMEDKLRLYREVFMKTSDGVALIDGEGRVIERNPAHHRHTGLSDDEVRNVPLQQLIGTYGDEVLRAVRDQGVYRGVISFVRKGGKQKHIDLSVFSVLDDNGALLCYAGIGRDVTETREMYRALERSNAELQQTQAQLVQSEKMASLGMLVAGIAHEINTPVGAMSSIQETAVRSVEQLKQLLAEDLQHSDARGNRLRRVLHTMDEANDVISSGASRVTEIVRRLRSFARLDEAELKRVDIHQGLEDTLTIIHHELKHKAKVERRFGKLPAIPCYAGRLNQVFLNILVNATQAIENDGHILVSTYGRDDRDIVVEISDDGCGMPQATLARIFDPGFTTKGVGVGTGLGLSICFQIVQDHRGAIEVDSELGRGTTFRVVIPTNLDEILGITL